MDKVDKGIFEWCQNCHVLAWIGWFHSRYWGCIWHEQIGDQCATQSKSVITFTLFTIANFLKCFVNNLKRDIIARNINRLDICIIWYDDVTYYMCTLRWLMIILSSAQHQVSKNCNLATKWVWCKLTNKWHYFFAPIVVCMNPNELSSLMTLPHMIRTVSKPCFVAAPSSCIQNINTWHHWDLRNVPV